MATLPNVTAKGGVDDVDVHTGSDLRGRQHLVCWVSPDEFAVLRQPVLFTMPRQAFWLALLVDAWMALIIIPPILLTFLMATVMRAYPPIRELMTLPLALAIIATMVYIIFIVLIQLLDSLISLYRQLRDWATGRRVRELLLEQNWSLELCHVTDPDRSAHMLRATLARIGVLAGSASPDPTPGGVTLVWSDARITTAAARAATRTATQVASLTGSGLQIMRASGDESAPRFDPTGSVPVTRFIAAIGLFPCVAMGFLALMAAALAQEERAVCGTQCDGRPASFQTAFWWLFGYVTFRGAPDGLAPATRWQAFMVSATFMGALIVTVTVIGVVVSGVKLARTRTKTTQEFEQDLQQSLLTSAKSAWGSVFINYRQGTEDHTLAVAGLYRTLTDRFGTDKVFLDIRSMLPGIHYPADLRAKLDASTVLLAVIQQGWLQRLTEREHTGSPDWVRYEISTALLAGKTVVPVLLNDVALPTADQLPPELAGLAHRQACRLRWTSLDEDLTRLVAAIEPHLRVGRQSTSHPLPIHQPTPSLRVTTTADGRQDAEIAHTAAGDAGLTAPRCADTGSEPGLVPGEGNKTSTSPI